MGGVGYQIVDALDTFLVMGLEEEYGRAAGWVRDNLNWEKDAEFSTFEVSPLFYSILQIRRRRREDELDVYVLSEPGNRSFSTYKPELTHRRQRSDSSEVSSRHIT